MVSLIIKFKSDHQFQYINSKQEGLETERAIHPELGHFNHGTEEIAEGKCETWLTCSSLEATDAKGNEEL